MDHVCEVCCLDMSQHDERCSVGEPLGASPHLHYPPLCCPECPCQSFKQAHPEEFGVPIWKVEGITPLLVRILTQNMVLTDADLMDEYPHRLIRMKGIGIRRFSRLAEVRLRLRMAREATVAADG